MEVYLVRKAESEAGIMLEDYLTSIFIADDLALLFVRTIHIDGLALESVFK